MAEINKIKVGETTYDVNPSWATGDGVNTAIQIGGQDKYITIGTHGPITMSTAVEIMSTAKVHSIDVANKGLYIIGGTISIGSNINNNVNITGTLLINGNPIPDVGTLGTIQKFVKVEDYSLFLGTCANLIQIGTGEYSIAMNSLGDVRIGDTSRGITLSNNGDIKIGSTNEGIMLNPSNIQIGTEGRFGASIHITAQGTTYFGRAGNGYAIDIAGNCVIADNIKIGSGTNDTVDFAGRRVNIYNLASPEGAGGYLRIGNTDLDAESHIILEGDVKMNGPVTIGGFLFETNTSTGTLTISYNGKKAGIQLA